MSPKAPILGVRLSMVVRDLEAGIPARDVLHQLNSGCDYLEPLSNDDEVAIISYRIQHAPSEDKFTLGIDAFLSAVAAARARGIDALWLDCWAYREQPPWAEYRHLTFLRTLANVMARVSLVIWLPRSRESALGEYQQRIWTTYEATMVATRGLPVVVAGFDLDAGQRRIVAFGTFFLLPPWYGWRSALRARWSSRRRQDTRTRSERKYAANYPAGLIALGRLNGAFAAAACAALIRLVLVHQYRLPHPEEATGSGIALTALANYSVYVLAWVSARNCGRISGAKRLVLHGGRVLTLMYKAAAASGSGSEQMEWDETALLPEVEVEPILRNLPWLPGYDRRDCLSCVYMLASGDQTCDQSVALRVQAVALSVYLHALFHPSSGDDPTRTKNLRAWFAEVGMKLYSVDTLLHSRTFLGMGSRWWNEEPEELPTACWLDGAPEWTRRPNSDRTPAMVISAVDVEVQVQPADAAQESRSGTIAVNNVKVVQWREEEEEETSARREPRTAFAEPEASRASAAQSDSSKRLSDRRRTRMERFRSRLGKVAGRVSKSLFWRSAEGGDGLDASQLRAAGWSFVRGAAGGGGLAIAATPMGSCFVQAPSPDTQTIWPRLHMSRAERIPTLELANAVLIVLLAEVVQEVMQAALTVLSALCRGSCGVASGLGRGEADYVTSAGNLLIAAALLTASITKFRWQWHVWRKVGHLPPPVLKSGKLEYASVLLAVAYYQYSYISVRPYFGTSPTYFGTITTTALVALLADVAWLIATLPALLTEAGLAAWWAFAAALRYSDARFLSQFGERHLDAASAVS